MGGLMNCFKSHQAKLNSQEAAILECKQCRDKIKAYIKRLEKNESLQKAKTKEYLKQKDRQKAKLCLNQSKFYRKQIEISNGQLNMIDDQISSIETAQSQKETLKVLDNGNKVLKELQKEVNIEKWEKVSDDLNELKENQNEIADFLKSHNVNNEEFEEELNNELENLMKYESNQLEVELPNASSKEHQTEKKEPIINNNIEKNKEGKIALEV